MAANSWISDVGTGLGIALSDLVHEWRLSLCLVLAIAAVIAPLLLLFGLKYGTIATLRSRLVQDPRNREIIPMVTRSFNKEWFERMASRPDVAFVLPTIRQIAASIDVRLTQSDQPRGVRLDIVPTGPGDALLLDNGAEIPGEGECVLSRQAADEVGAKTGDRLQGTINRSRSGKFESASLTLQVKAVLSDRAGLLKAMYTPLVLVEAAEAYRDGRAVARYGWPGELPLAYPKYDGFILLFPQSLPEGDQLALAVGTGLSQIREIRPDEGPRLLGFALPKSFYGYLLQVFRSPVGPESLDVVREKLRGRNAIVIPYVKPITARLTGEATGAAADLQLLGYWGAPEVLKKLGQPDLPAFAEGKPRKNAAPLLKVVLPAGGGLGETGDTVTMTVSEAGHTLSFPAQIAARTETGGSGLVSSELLGIVNTLRQREVFFDWNEQEFLLGRMTYAGFRMYARSIDEVEPLRRLLADEGIDVSTRAEDIARVKAMDRGLTRVFWLVAVVGIVGCMAAMMASLASSVERKKRDLSVLRLMGISGWLIIQVPVSQAVILGVMGFLTAMAGFSGIAAIINEVFGNDLMPGEKICKLAANHFGAALVGTLVVVVFSSLFSAWQATRIDPAEALRDE